MDAVIFDMDGTLCDVEPIRHYVTGPRRDFTAFHNASLFCRPIFPVAVAAREYARDPSIAVIIVTARDERFERPTRDWLTKHGIEFDAIFMRPSGDQRHDTVVKQEIHDRIVVSGYRPRIAFDDRDDIIRVWESNGIATVKVG